MARPFTLAVFTKNRVNPAYAAARLAADRVAAEAGARTLHFVPTTPDDVGQQKALVGKALAAVPDDVAVGHTAAKALFAALPGGGRIVAIEGTPAAPTSRDRTVGLSKALAET